MSIAPKQSLLSSSASLFYDYFVWLSLPNCRSLPFRLGLSFSQTWSKIGSALNVAAYYATFLTCQPAVPPARPSRLNPPSNLQYCLVQYHQQAVSLPPSLPPPGPLLRRYATLRRYVAATLVITTLHSSVAAAALLELVQFLHYRCAWVHLGAPPPCQPVYPISWILVQPNPKRNLLTLFL